MKKRIINTLLLISIITFGQSKTTKLPWENGKLKVTENGRYLQHENGEPFFWLGDTGWLLPERLNREEAECFSNLYEVYNEILKAQGAYSFEYLIRNNKQKDYIPATSLEYIQKVIALSLISNRDLFKNIDKKGVYGYWEHLDFIIKAAEKRGIYIGMDCIWGGLVGSGQMDVKQAQVYGKFLAERYKNSPNIIWFIGGDIRGDIKTEVWEALAVSIKSVDKNHLMTYHPRGRTSSATWFNNAEWLDFNMFLSGHRRFGLRIGDGDYTIAENTEEDNWMYVEKGLAMTPLKPIIDGEPSYEDIPQGLHDFKEVRWSADDVRRYAYWSVFAGAFGHTYGQNSVRQVYNLVVS